MRLVNEDLGNVRQSSHGDHGSAGETCLTDVNGFQNREMKWCGYQLCQKNWIGTPAGCSVLFRPLPARRLGVGPGGEASFPGFKGRQLQVRPQGQNKRSKKRRMPNRFYRWRGLILSQQFVQLSPSNKVLHSNCLKGKAEAREVRDN